MVYDRYPRAGERGGYNDRNDLSDYGQDYSGGSGDPYRYSSARDYAASNEGGQGGGRGRDDGRRDYGNERYGQRERMGGGYGGGDYQRGGPGGYRGDREGRGRNFGGGDDGRQEFSGGSDYYRGEQRGYGGGQASGRAWGGDSDRQQRGGGERQRYRDNDSGDDRGFFARAEDEVRSWFGDDEAERRREQDARRDEPTSVRNNYAHDEHYHHWRNEQLAAFDRDYHEYRQENRSKFHNEFTSWRSERQGQRDLLNRVEEHAEVVGSDGEHVGTVDKVRGDRIILTKNDADAGGRHHSIPSRWLQSVEGNRVTLRKSAAEAKQHWRDEERQDEGHSALFGKDQGRGDDEQSSTRGGTNLNRSFSGTY